MRNFIKDAMSIFANNLNKSQSGLYVPDDLIKGKHFGGFRGYEPWIQQCIRVCCAAARGVRPDELAETTALAYWHGPDGADESRNPLQDISVGVHKHAEALRLLAGFAEFASKGQGTLSDEVLEQVKRVEGTRDTGTFVVIAVRFVVTEDGHGDHWRRMMTSVSAWTPASVEEAEAVPKQQYLLG